MSIESKIRGDSKDCWNPKTAGSIAGDLWIDKGILGDARFKVRPSQSNFQGIKTCHLFDTGRWDGYERYEPDPQDRQALWQDRLDANEREDQNMHVGTAK